MVSPAMITVACSWTDKLTAWGTAGTALAAVAGLAVSIGLAWQERDRRGKELLRQERLSQLAEIGEQYNSYRQAAKSEDADGQAAAAMRLKYQLAFMPEGMARMLKHQFGVTLTPKDAMVLTDAFQGAVPAKPPEDMVLAELRSNHRYAGLGYPEASVACSFRALTDRIKRWNPLRRSKSG